MGPTRVRPWGACADAVNGVATMNARAVRPDTRVAADLANAAGKCGDAGERMGLLCLQYGTVTFGCLWVRIGMAVSGGQRWARSRSLYESGHSRMSPHSSERRDCPLPGCDST